MSVVIGLGTVACKIAQNFSQYPQYKIYSYDVADNDYVNYKPIPNCASHENYERCKLKFDIRSREKDVIFIVCGAGKSSGLCLRMLEKLKNKNIDVLYIKPDIDILSERAAMRERLTSQVLQQYARSALLRSVTMIDNLSVSSVVGDVSVAEYWDTINQTIVSTYHMINVFKNSHSDLSTFSDLPVTARINTIGIVADNEDKLFYPLLMAREKLYYYAISKKTMDEEKGLYNKITDSIKAKSEDKVRCSFGIFPTNYEVDYVYTLQVSSLIQGE
tara:strand:- start:1197 stop:2018 length:822 start_codon:yes stop_codon:yes gene_type:complete